MTRMNILNKLLFGAAEDSQAKYFEGKFVKLAWNYRSLDILMFCFNLIIDLSTQLIILKKLLRYLGFSRNEIQLKGET